MWKRVFEHMRTAKAQISLRIRAVWSGPLLSAKKKSSDTKECFSGEKMPEWDCALCRIMRIRTFCACSKRPFLNFTRYGPYGNRKNWSVFLDDYQQIFRDAVYKFLYHPKVLSPSNKKLIMYSQTSMVRKSLGPWFVLDIGSSGHWGLTIASCQKANGDHHENKPI